MGQDRQEDHRTFGDIRREQLHIYANELAQLYALLRSRSRVWLEAEERLRTRGTHAEALHQLLSAAHVYSQLALGGDLAPEERQAVAQRLPYLLERAVAILRDDRKESGTPGVDDLGLAALLRQEVYGLASEHDWDVNLETENVRPCPLSETVAHLVVREALTRAALDPCTRGVAISAKARDDQLTIKLTLYGNGTGPVGDPEEDTAQVALIRLSARLAGGSCQWRRVPGSAAGGGEATEMELTLPLDTPQPAEH